MRCLFLVRAGLKTTILSTTVFTLLFSANSGLDSAAQAATIYEESVGGDLPNYGSPTIPPPAPPKSVGTLSLGSNVVTGVFGHDGTTTLGYIPDSDMLTFFVPGGHKLSAIHLTYSAAASPSVGSYMAIQDGTTIGTTYGTVTDNLSNALVKASGELLAIFEAGSHSGGVKGLTAPLPSGHYSMFFNETALGAEITYSLDFVVVPEPTALTLFGLAGLLSLAKRPRRLKCKKRAF